MSRWPPTCSADGEVETIDTGEAMGVDGEVVPFFEAGSIGLNAAIFREVSRADEGDPVRSRAPSGSPSATGRHGWSSSLTTEW